MAKKRTIYVVKSREGDYEAIERLLVAFENKAAAEAEAKRRDAICREWQAKVDALGDEPWPHDTPESVTWWAKRDRLRKRAAKLTGGSERGDPDDMSYFVCAVPLALPSPPKETPNG